MGVIKRLILSACLLMSPASAIAASWYQVSGSKSGAVWYVDADSIKVVDDGYKNGVRKAWIKIDYSEVKSEPAREGKVLFFFDCLNETAKSSTWIEYRADGTVLRDISSNYPTYKVVVPETVLSGAMQVICELNL